MFVSLVFSVLNPLVIPFALLYFCVEYGGSISGRKPLILMELHCSYHQEPTPSCLRETVRRQREKLADSILALQP
jgi:hypothetical protein